jgi:hypothetical protein
MHLPPWKETFPFLRHWHTFLLFVVFFEYCSWLNFFRVAADLLAFQTNDLYEAEEVVALETGHHFWDRYSFATPPQLTKSSMYYLMGYF